VWIFVGPWFTAFPIWEVSVGASGGDVEDEIVWLVERSALFGFVLPWVVHALWEFSLSPHVFVEWEV
jgi:hypothetical protein